MTESASVRRRLASGGPWIMVVLAALVGLASGAVAVALRHGVHVLFELLHGLRGTVVGILLPAAGALAGVWIVRLLFREPGGHGVPDVLEAVSRGGGAMRRRSIFSRLLGSLVTVASGGSAGLEGPIVFSSAAVGSTLGKLFDLAERQCTLLLACGVAGGIGGIFNAPLTGLIFATEVVLAEWSLAAVIPIAVSATVATELAREILGSEGAFQHGGQLFQSVDLLACVGLGLMSGGFSTALVKVIHWVEYQARVLRLNRIFRKTGMTAAVAGIGVGLIGYWAPEAIGEGYETVQASLSGDLGAGLAVISLLLIAKLVATALTLGSGTPGGIFAPSLVLGSLLGTVYGSALIGLLPTVGFADPAFYALVAMAGLVAGTMQAPFTGIFLVMEATGGWELTLPLMLVSVLSVLVTRSLQRYSFYTDELARKGRLLRPGTDSRILADLTAGEILDTESPRIEAGSSLKDLVARLPETRRNQFAVIEAGTERLLGVLDVAQLRGFIFDETLRTMTPVDTVMDTSLPRVRHSDSLMRAMDLFDQSGAWVLPVVDGQRFVGMLSKSTLFERYRRELIVQTSGRD